MDPLFALRDRLRGPPLALPAVLDRLSERWWALPPRARLAAGGVAVLGLLAVAGLGAARSPWGERVSVRVARRALPAGHVVTEADLTTRSWPSAIAPDEVAALGRRLSMGVPAGGVLRPGHLGAGGPAANLRPGQVAVPLHRDALAAGASGGGALSGPGGRAPPGAGLEPGQRLDLLGGDPTGAPRVLARGARVLAAADGRLWVAVAREEAPRVAAAAAAGAISVAVLAPGGR